MSSDFNTGLTVRGTKEEYLAILKVLHTYADERYQQYREHRNCWYLDEKIGEVTEKTLENYLKNGVFSILLSGPYGVMNGPVPDEVDLFERLADAAPSCSFEGSISGWDPGANQGIDAKLNNGLLYLRYMYKEFGDEWDDEDLITCDFCNERFEEEEIIRVLTPEGEACNVCYDCYEEHGLYDWEKAVDDEDDEAEDEEEEDVDWDTVYDPITHEYHSFESGKPGDSVTVSITLTDQQGKCYQLLLPSEDIEDPINLHCFPRDFLEADTADKLIDLLLHALDGGGWKKRREEILAWKREIPVEGFAALELRKVHDHEELLFFGWLRSNALGEKENLKKIAKKVLTCSEKNRPNKLAEFQEQIAACKPWFPGSEFCGWPEFCVWRVKGEPDPAGTEQQFRPFERDPESSLVPVLDWHCAASSLEDFARLLCSKEDPREYAMETVSIDYAAHTAKQSAVYMPGGPTPKAAPTEVPSAEEKTTAPTVDATADACKGLTFVITGKVCRFENRDAFTAYVERQGGKVSGSVSKKTDFLVCNDGDSASSKAKKAAELGVPVLTEEEFVGRFGFSNN